MDAWKTDLKPSMTMKMNYGSRVLRAEHRSRSHGFMIDNSTLMP